MSYSPAAFAAAIGMDRTPGRYSGSRGSRLASIRWVWVLAAAAVVAVTTSAVDPMSVHYYETKVGESRTVGCAGSRITLNAESRVAIQCARNLLRAHVLRGEASFRMPQDASSTAVVQAGDARVDAIGTHFSVRRDADQSTVTVMEGTVILSALESGQDGTTTDEMPVWAGERAAVINTGSKVILTAKPKSRSSQAHVLFSS
jgi:ferric-dicitrate binding protein FerR (iron transport regulator)